MPADNQGSRTKATFLEWLEILFQPSTSPWECKPLLYTHTHTDTGSSATLPQSTMGESGRGPEGTRKAGTSLSLQSQFCKVEPTIAFHR